MLGQRHTLPPPSPRNTYTQRLQVLSFVTLRDNCHKSCVPLSFYPKHSSFDGGIRDYTAFCPKNQSPTKANSIGLRLSNQNLSFLLCKIAGSNSLGLKRTRTVLWRAKL